MRLALRYLYDLSLHRAANTRERNYWPAYFPELAATIGVSAAPLGRDDLTATGLSSVRALVLPPLHRGYLSAQQAGAIESWVRDGGVLIGLATEGLDEVFGLRETGALPQGDDPFTIAGVLRLTDPDLARPIYSPETLDAPIPIPAGLRLVEPECRELACLGETQESDAASAISLRELGAGWAGYLPFDLCHAVWAMRQGRPIAADVDGDGYLRSSDGIITRPFRTDVPYAELLLVLLRNVIALGRIPFVHPLPPTPDRAPADALFHWGGDDEGGEGIQVAASDWMRAQGLPYHINIMPKEDGTFGLTAADFAHLKANGHETSLHFNFIQGYEHPYAFTREDIHRQFALYRGAFGETPVCTVFHWTAWNAWAEPAEWMAECGIQADNSRVHVGSPPINPVNMLGYAYGAAYPYRLWSDWRKGNQPVDFLIEPITAYECGYVCGQGTDFTHLHRAIRDAGYWRLTMDMFHHPIYIAEWQECREGILEGLRYAEELGLKTIHMGNDELNHWWRARMATRVDETSQGLEVDCPWPAGCVVMRPSEDGVEDLGGKWEYEVCG